MWASVLVGLAGACPQAVAISDVGDIDPPRKVVLKAQPLIGY